MSTKTHKPGTTTDLSSSVITVVKGGVNPGSKGSDRRRRFALMSTGLTVGDWYAKCRNNPSITGKAHSKLARRAVSTGYITLKTSK
jgi:hypothetical protein